MLFASKGKSQKKRIVIREFSKPKRVDRSLLFKGFVVFFVCVVSGVILWGVHSFFRVRTILCTDGEQVCEANIQSFLQGDLGKSMFRSFSFDIPTKKGTVTKKYPNTLLVHIETSQVLCMILTGVEGQEKAIVFADGQVSWDSKKTSVDLGNQPIIVDSSLHEGNTTHSLSAQKLGGLKTLLQSSQSLFITRIRIHSDEEVEIETSREMTAIVSFADITRELHSLQVILTSPTIDQKPARVDLRFSRPVLRYL